MGIENASFKITAEDATAAAFRSVKASLSDVQGAALSVKGAFSAIASAGLVVGLAATAKHAIDTADSIGKMSQKIGVSVESLSTLTYAASLSDLSMDALGDGLKKLAVNMQGTEADAGDAKKAFAALKIGVEEAGGGLRTTEDVLLDIAEKFSRMEDGAGKTAFAVKLFGRSGVELIPFLNQGRAGIKALTDEAEKLGLKLSGETARAAEEFNDNLTTLTASFHGAARAIMTAALPGMINITNAMHDGAVEGGVLRGVLEGLRRGFADLFFDNTADKLKKVNAEIERTTAQIKRLESGKVRGIDEAPIAASSAHLSNLYRQQRELLELQSIETPGDAFGKPPARPKGGRAPALPGKDDSAKRQSEANWLAKQLQEGEEEWTKTLTEAQKAYAEFSNKQIENDKRIEEERVANIWKTYDVLQEAEDELQREFHRNTKSLTERGDEMTEFWKEAARSMQASMSGLFFDVMQGELSDLAGSFKRTVDRMVADMLAAKAATALFGADFGKGGNIGGFVGKGLDWLTGSGGGEMVGAFASGGSFTVGGSGGTDSKLVSFLATPGEKVSVQTPAQQQASGGNRGIVVHMNVSTPDAGSFAQNRGQMVADLARALSAARRNL